MTTTIKRGASRLEGVGRLADELGYSRFHLGAVLHGRRPCPPELRADLEARGIAVPKRARRARA
jgi:hypothetical protein